MNNTAKTICRTLENLGATCLFVGGCVRDRLMSVDSKDIDVEVYNLSMEDLIEALSDFGRVDCVGKSFGVVKLSCTGGDFDFSLPRRDNLGNGVGHKNFTVEIDDSMTPREAASRRDFTINSVAMDLDGNLIDPFNGVEDIRSGILRATSEAYAEDALRVLRGMQFCARFDMVSDYKTRDLSRGMLIDAKDIAVERIREEWVKWALRGTDPSMGLAFLWDTHWTKLFPELHVLGGLEQEYEYHPEGDVFVHTALVCDAAAEIAVRDGLNDTDRLVLMLSALCHDLGKATTTQVIDGRIRAPGHATAGEQPTRSLLARMGFVQRDIVEPVVSLVKEHMSHVAMEVNSRSVRRLAVRVAPASIAQLVRLMEADHSGRPPLPVGCPAKCKQILEISKELEIEDSKPKPLVMGRHLVEMGFVPGPYFSVILDNMYQRQLDGEFTTVEEALEGGIFT